MISGFFTALNSFSDSFEDLGTISELKLSNNDLKLSFLKDNSIPNLIYLATYDDTSKAVNVQRVLRKISKTFLMKYNINQILNWSGRVNAFKSFDEILENYQYEEIEENDLSFKERVMDLFKNVEEKLNEESNLIALREDNRKSPNVPEYCIQVPKSVSSLNINPKHYLTGEISHKVFNRINGESSIEKIAELVGCSHKNVFNICKNLIKLGFITMD
ncbi:MAG: hypothetical protein ACTSR7_11560 [Promethearchaeota archaeon]